MNIHWKVWCWSWSSNALATWWKETTYWKRPWWWEILKAGGKGGTEDETAGWHPWLNAHEFEQTLGDSERQGSQMCYTVHEVAKSWTQFRIKKQQMVCLHVFYGISLIICYINISKASVRKQKNTAMHLYQLVNIVKYNKLKFLLQTLYFKL